MNWLSAALLAVAVLAAALSSLGVLLMRDALDRLHYLGPITVVSAPAVFAAIAIEHGLGAMTYRSAIVMLILLATGPIVSHAIGRAAHVRGDARRLRGEQSEITE